MQFNNCITNQDSVLLGSKSSSFPLVEGGTEHQVLCTSMNKDTLSLCFSIKAQAHLMWHMMCCM